MDNELILRQKNVISRSIYTMASTERKILAYAMYKLPYSKDGRTLEFNLRHLVKDLGMTYGSHSKEIFSKAEKSLEKQTVILQDEEFEVDGHKEFRREVFPWFSYLKFDTVENKFIVRFNKDLIDYIKDYQGWSLLELKIMGSLTSSYAIRYYEIAKSYQGFAGKNGNKRNEWYFEYEVGQLVDLFQLYKPNKEPLYSRVADMKKYVVDNPIKELNEKNVGFYIEVETLREGQRKISGFHFTCKEGPSPTLSEIENRPKRQYTKRQNVVAPEKPAVYTQEEKERIIEDNQAVYDLLLKKELDKITSSPGFFPADTLEGAARETAFEKLLRTLD